MKSYLSLNRQKISAKTKVNRLASEISRTDGREWDTGYRVMHAEKTQDNLELYVDPRLKYGHAGGNLSLDELRTARLNAVNGRRKVRTDIPSYEAWASEKKFRKEKGKKVKLNLKSPTKKDLQSYNRSVGRYKNPLRRDTVDLSMVVVQPSDDFIKSLPDEESRDKFFSDCLGVIKDDPKTYGKVLMAYVHKDENSYHLHILTDMIDSEKMESVAKRAFGNKSKMSDDQTKFVKQVQEKGWAVERGLKRIDNPGYQTWKESVEAKGYEVSRFNDAKLLQEQTALGEKELELSNKEKKLADQKADQKSSQSELDSGWDEYNQAFDELETYWADYDNKEKLQKEKEDKQKQRGEDLAKREQAVASREQAVVNREKKVSQLYEAVKNLYQKARTAVNKIKDFLEKYPSPEKLETAARDQIFRPAEMKEYKKLRSESEESVFSAEEMEKLRKGEKSPREPEMRRQKGTGLER